MDSDNNNQDNTASVDALKDLTAELENLKAEDLAAETPTETSAEVSTESPTESPAETPSEPQADTPAETSAEAPAESPEAPETPETTESSGSSDTPAGLEVPESTESAPVTPPTFDPSTLGEIATSTESTPEPEPEPTPEPTSQVADFTNETTETTSSSDDEKKDDKANQEPIKPAAPVPGSIGSAKSYEDYQTDEANRVNREADEAARAADKAAKEAAVKKTTSTALILGIVIAAILIIAAVIFALVTISNKPAKIVDTPTPEPTPEPTFSSITCTKELSGTELAALGSDATEAFNTITATYYDDQLNDISDKTIIEYANKNAAEDAATTLKSAYESTLALLDITADPFDSTYPVVDTTLTITHLADAEKITAENFAMFGLRIDADGNVQSDIKTIEELYTDKDFTCIIK